MKHLIKTIFGLSIAALLTVFISCPQPAGPGGGSSGTVTPVPESPGGGNNGTVTPVPESPVEKALGELTVSPLKVYKHTAKLELSTTSVPGVTITWTASPEGYINLESGADFGKIIKREPAAGTEKTEVTLTAKATKDGETKTKTFTVTVYPESAEPSAQDLADFLSLSSAVFSANVTLQKSVDGYPSSVVTWASADENIIKIETVGTELKGIIGYDLIDRTVKLTATVNYNSGIGTKEFNVTVDRVSEIKEEYNENDSEGNPITFIKKYEFTGTELVITETKKADNVLRWGVKFAYTDVQTASDGTKTAVFQKTANYNNGSWKTSQQLLEEMRNLINKMLTELEKLKNKSSLTLQDFRESFSRISDKNFNSMSDEEFFGLVKGNIGLACSYEEFTAFSDADKSAKLKDGIERTVPYLRQQLPFLTMNNISPVVLCAYSFERGLDGKLAFAAISHYDSGKPWYDQKGMYIFDNTESPSPNTIKRITLSVGKNGPDTYDANIMIEKTDGSNNPKNYDGTTPYTPGDTSITTTLTERNNPSDTITVTISGIPVPSDGTMSILVQIDGGTAQPYTLKFQGYFFTR